MSVLVDALRTEVLYLDGNPDFIVPQSTIAFLEEASEAIEDLVEALAAIDLARTTDEAKDWMRASALSDAALSKFSPPKSK